MVKHIGKIYVSEVSATLLAHSISLQEPIRKIWNKYFQKRNCAATVPISTFMCLWAIYIFPWSICCCRKYVDRSWEYINCSQTRECGNWDGGHAIPRKGIHKWYFRCSANWTLDYYWYISHVPEPLKLYYITLIYERKMWKRSLWLLPNTEVTAKKLFTCSLICLYYMQFINTSPTLINNMWKDVLIYIFTLPSPMFFHHNLAVIELL